MGLLERLACRYLRGKVTHPAPPRRGWAGRTLANLGLAAASIIIFVGALELCFSLFHLTRHRTWSRAALVRAREQCLLNAVSDSLRGTGRLESELRLHPLFGYVHDPDSPGANNFGFLTPHDFELTEDGYVLRGRDPQRTMVVGVFGGSFAQQLAFATHEHLAAHIGRAYPGKDLVVVNFALEGHAIPQTAFVFLYFRSLVDVAMFVDGYNELWNYVNNNKAGCPPEYAKAAHYLFKTSLEELTPERFARTARLLRLLERRNALTRCSLRGPLRSSVLAHMVWTRVTHYLERVAATESASIEQSYEGCSPFMAASDSEMVRIAAHQWGVYHRMVHVVAANEGILDLHALQPNIYVPGSKKSLSDGERRVLDADRGSPRGRCLAEGYPLLQREMAALGNDHVPVADLTDVFSSCTEERWTDVCHTNPAGYRTVADHILTALEAGGLTTPMPREMEGAASRDP